MKTETVRTRFMLAQKDVENVIFDLLVETYGHEKAFECQLCNDDVLFSEGFILAINEGKIPTLETRENAGFKKGQEYHHFLLNDKCFIAYFTELN